MEAKVNFIDQYFGISKRNSSFLKEIISGLIVFISMCYIIFVQESIMSDGIGIWNLSHPGDEVIIPKWTFGIITAIAAGFASILMGMYANYPVSLASGMGANAFISYTLIATGKMSPLSVFVAVFLSGLIFVIVSSTGLRKRILNSIPDNIKTSISIGVGFFIMYIALSNSGIIISGGGTPTGLGLFSDPSVLLAMFGIVVTIILWIYDLKGYIIISIGLTLLLGLVLNVSGLESSNPSNPLPSLNWGELNYKDSFGGMGLLFGQSFIQMGNVKEVWANPNFYVALLTLFLTDFFDTAGTLFSINESIDFEDKEKCSNKALVVDAVSTTFCSIIGSTNVTSFAESTVGVQNGGRTGLTSITVGLLFFISIPFIPLLGGLITPSITAGAMMIVGISMARLLNKIQFDDKVIFASSIIIIIFTLLTFSIGTGIVIGLLMYIILMVSTGRIKELDMYLLLFSPILVSFIILPLLV